MFKRLKTRVWLTGLFIALGALLVWLEPGGPQQVAIDPDGKLWIYPNRTPLSKEQQEQINTLISRALRLAATRYAQAEFVLAAKRAGLRISGASPVPGGRKIILEV